MNRSQRISGVALALVVMLALSGCHKKQVRASHPPPLLPAKPTSGNDASGSTRPTTPGTTAPAKPAPLPPNLSERPSLVESGLASWYGPPYAGRKGADGTVYDQNAMTAAHLSLPMGSIVRVTNLTTKQSAVVKITDRGPFVRGRIIDLSLAAAKATGVYRMGVAKVQVEAWTPPPSTSPTAIPGGRWCVQVGAFQSEKDAQKLKSQLMRRYTTAKVIEFPGPTGHWVRINPAHPDKRAATEVADGIHASGGAEPFLIRTD